MKEQERMEETTFDLNETILIVRGWAWLLLLGLLLGAGLTLLVSTSLDPVYQAATKVLVTRTGQSHSSEFTGYLSDLQLAQTYLQLLTTRTVLDTTSARTGVQIEPEDIKGQVIRDTQIITLEVENSDPEQAALIANTMVEVLIEQNELIQSGRYDTMEESLRGQKTQIESEIQNIEGQIEQISRQSMDEQRVWFEDQISSLQKEEIALKQEIAESSGAKSPGDRPLLDLRTARLEQVRSLLTLYQDNYSNLLLVYGNPAQGNSNTTNSQLTMLVTTQKLYEQYYVSVLDDLESIHLARMQNIPNVVQIERAFPPDDPIRPRILLNTMLGGLLGFVLILGVVFSYETLNDTLKTPQDVEQALAVPVLGFVPELQFKDTSEEAVSAFWQSPSLISESFRAVRASLEFACLKESIHSILVTSSGPAEGKSTVAANLAVSLALSGKRVALLDADLRRPQIHRFFGMHNLYGLRNLLESQPAVSSVSRIHQDLPQLTIITSGNLPPNPAALLDSDRIVQILAELRAQVDMIVIDTPSSFVADAQILGGKVDAVLFVIRPRKTSSERAKTSLELFQRSGAHVVGTVLNRIPRNRGSYYGGYEYYSPYNNSKVHNGGKPTEPEKILTENGEKTSINPLLNRVDRLLQVPKDLPPPNPPRS